MNLKPKKIIFIVTRNFQAPRAPPKSVDDFESDFLLRWSFCFIAAFRRFSSLFSTSFFAIIAHANARLASATSAFATTAASCSLA